MTEEAYSSVEEELRKKDERIEELEEKIETTQSKLQKLNRNLEQRILDRTLEVKRLLRHKNKFIDNLSHDLGTPLTPLISLLPVIKDSVKDEETRKLIDTCIRNVEYIKRVVNNTRKLAELSTTDLLLKKENLYNLINKLETKYEPVFKTFNIEVKNDIPQNVHIKTEKTKILELFDQIASNAVNNMPEGGKLIFESKYVKRKNGNYVQISVSDTGKGLNREQTDHIFEEFYKADTSRHKLDSTGLGLAICRRIVEKHGGKIWAESHGEGTGTTIHFTMPTTEIAQTRSFI